MGKGPTGRKGNRATRYSKIGNTSWQVAQILGLIDEDGKQLDKETRTETQERIKKILYKGKEIENVEQRRDSKFIRKVKNRLGVGKSSHGSRSTSSQNPTE